MSAETFITQHVAGIIPSTTGGFWLTESTGLSGKRKLGFPTALGSTIEDLVRNAPSWMHQATKAHHWQNYPMVYRFRLRSTLHPFRCLVPLAPENANGLQHLTFEELHQLAVDEKLAGNTQSVIEQTRAVFGIY